MSDDQMGVHMLTGAFLMDLLRRAHGGEEPDHIMVEIWANAWHVTGRVEFDETEEDED